MRGKRVERGQRFPAEEPRLGSGILGYGQTEILRGGPEEALEMKALVSTSLRDCSHGNLRERMGFSEWLRRK